MSAPLAKRARRRRWRRREGRADVPIRKIAERVHNAAVGQHFLDKGKVRAIALQMLAVRLVGEVIQRPVGDPPFLEFCVQRGQERAQECAVLRTVRRRLMSEAAHSPAVFPDIDVGARLCAPLRKQVVHLKVRGARRACDRDERFQRGKIKGVRAVLLRHADELHVGAVVSHGGIERGRETGYENVLIPCATAVRMKFSTSAK